MDGIPSIPMASSSVEWFATEIAFLRMNEAVKNGEEGIMRQAVIADRIRTPFCRADKEKGWPSFHRKGEEYDY
jgi:peptide methionine sulfoxide reductase MsrB